ncbi:hypothetical protein [Streptomyces chartreusis]|uniref:hypothetical protein n=1 Tax=Streptomyces chartreusis TaxID=1969 RepID=UPI0036AD621B
MHSSVGHEIVGETLGLGLDLPLAHEAIAPVGKGSQMPLQIYFRIDCVDPDQSPASACS